ncbi:MAG: DUF3971 domain-containing protein [Rhodospirillales bacterium]
MIKRTIRHTVQVLGGLGAGLAIVIALAGWRLGEGPVSLGFLTPTMERILNLPGQQVKVTLADTILTWAGWDRALDILLVDVRGFDAQGRQVARLPELSVGLSAKALLEGVVALRSLDIRGPKLKLRRDLEGRFDLDFAGAEKSDVDVVEQMVRSVLTPETPDEPMSYLKRITVEDADLELIDERLGLSWQAPKAEMTLGRDDQGLVGDADLSIDMGGVNAHMAVVGRYHEKRDILSLDAAFDRLIPAHLAGVIPGLEPLAAATLPLAGNVKLELSSRGEVRTASAQIKGQEGFLDLPDPVNQSLAVEELAMSVTFDATAGLVSLSEGRIAFAKGTVLALPMLSDDFTPPLEGLAVSGRYDIGADKVTIGALDLNLAGPSGTVSGEASGLKAYLEAGTPFSARIEGRLTDMEMAELSHYWPRGLNDYARDWVVQNIPEGHVPEATIRIALQGDAQGIEAEEVTGRIDMSGGVVDYLHPMPVGTDGQAYAIFNKERFDITVQSGRVGDLQVTEGQVTILGLDQYDQTANIALTIDGPIPDALHLIDNKPLGYASAIGMLPDSTGGQAKTRLRLSFPLLSDLTFNQVDVTATSDLEDVTIADILWGRDMAANRLRLRVDEQGLDLVGKVEWGGIPADLAWRQNFGADWSFRSRYDLRADLSDIQRLRDLGLDLGSFDDQFVSGGVAARIGITVLDDRESWIETKVDLKDLAVDIPAAGLHKPKGQAGSAEAALILQKGLVAEIPLLTVKSGDIFIKGSALYDKIGGTGLQRLDLEKVSFGRNDMKAVLIPGDDGGWTISSHGKSADLEPLFDRLFSPSSGQPDGDKEAEDRLRLSLSVNMDQVWVDKENHLGLVTGTLVREGGRWRTINLDGLTDGKQGFFLRVEPAGDGHRKVTAQAQDAGGLLRTFDLFPDMVGGDLNLEASFDDNQPGSPLAGRLKVGEFRVVDAPVLAHLVSLMSLTGIVEALQGDGLAFNELDLPFAYHDDVLTLTDARASGLSLGFTLSGKYYADPDALDMAGTIVPAYVLNSVLGKIPLLGDLFTGGEKGGGLFAANYSLRGKLQEPDVSVNPLSALAPGFLRNLFGIFETKPDIPVANKPEEDKTPGPLPDIKSTK